MDLWNTDKATTVNNNNNANQRNVAPSTSVQNSMSAISSMERKASVNVMSFINYRDDKQDLCINTSKLCCKI